MNYQFFVRDKVFNFSPYLLHIYYINFLEINQFFDFFLLASDKVNIFSISLITFILYLIFKNFSIFRWAIFYESVFIEFCSCVNLERNPCVNSVLKVDKKRLFGSALPLHIFGVLMYHDGLFLAPHLVYTSHIHTHTLRHDGLICQGADTTDHKR